MRHIPELIIERIVIYADTKSLVLLAKSNRYIWNCISRQNDIWRERYMQQYSPDDDEERRWLIWYRKLLGRRSGTTWHNINWLFAYLRRQTTDANWFKNDTNQLKEIVKTEPIDNNDNEVDVLERVFFNCARLTDSYMVEQCQPIGQSNSKRYWRSRKPCDIGTNPNAIVKRHSMTNNYLVAILTTYAKYIPKYWGEQAEIFVWRTDRISTMQPRRLPCSNYSDHDIRDNWLMVCSSIKRPAEVHIKTTSIHIRNLGNDWKCEHAFNMFATFTFLQRVNRNTAIVFIAQGGKYEDRKVINWSLWQFSPCQPERSGCCLIRSRFNVINNYGNHLTIKRLDDKRVLVYCTHEKTFNREEALKDEIVTLAVISTDTNKQQQVIYDRQPLWWHCIEIVVAKELVSKNQIITFSSEGWTLYDLSDGARLSFTSINTIQSMITQYCASDALRYLYKGEDYKDYFVLCPSINRDSFVALNMRHPEETKNFAITTIFKHYKIRTKNVIVSNYSRTRHNPVFHLPNGRPNVQIDLRMDAVHLLHVLSRDDHRILDFTT